ncbi:hypothetical protein TSOC_000910 [Tetrabaena socialis]|uniref:Uncharacterized protein n=1 Tax=Tetrabaena socialis TaxID=47790 RepID=A0A2J8AI47_9CHLO|nr:hypothetical protein TSOC_000910 [Tetrabaena socialis]|eukprot:PNH12185.1 hypothetical protein TSOC_000910 [Tetrabaena socialis]
MDLAAMIAGASADRFKQECADNVCKIDIRTGESFSFALEVVPLAQHVLVRYKAMEYRMPRADGGAWEELCAFLADAIAEAYMTSMHALARENGLWPQYESFTLTVTRLGKEVFRSDFCDPDESRPSSESVSERMASDLKRYMKLLRFLN